MPLAQRVYDVWLPGIAQAKAAALEVENEALKDAANAANAARDAAEAR